MYWMNKWFSTYHNGEEIEFRPIVRGYSETKAILKYRLTRESREVTHYITLSVESQPPHRYFCKSKQPIAKKAIDWLASYVGGRLTFIR